jgi:C4-dicarboxylate-binding protein DctP
VTRAYFFCLLLACVALAPAAAGAEQIKLRITAQLPATNHLVVNLKQFKDDLEAKTKGTIQVEIFDSAKLFNEHQALGAVGSGAIEMGSVGVSFLQAKVPAVQIFGQPFLFNFDALMRAAVSPDRQMRGLLDKAVLEATGVRVLWWQAYGQSVFFSKGRGTKTPVAIRGQKIRVVGKDMEAFVKYCGGVPLLIAASKQNEALQNGTADMAMTGITGVTARELWKVTDTITRTEHAPLQFVVVINEKVWQSLSEGHKAVIAAAARKAEQDLQQHMADIESQAYAFARGKGMTIYDLTPDEVAEWRECSAPVLEDYMSHTGELGHLLMATYGKLRTDPCCSSGPSGTFTRR